MINEEYYLLLPIEVARREFLSKLYVGLKGARRGYNVVIGEHARPVFRKFSKGFLLYKDHAPWSLDRLTKFKHRGLNIGCLDEEGLIYKSDYIYRKTRCAPELLRLSDAIFLWGDNQRQIMKGLSRDDNWFCVGNPRIDIFNALKKKNGELGRFKNILVNTRFPSCNGFRGEAEIYNLKKLKLVSNDKEYKEYIEFVRRDRMIFDGFLDLIRQLSENDQYRITIRPHPGESVSIYKDIAAERYNVVVDNDEELVKQVDDNDIVIHDGCTTAIEAATAGKTVLGFRPNGADLDYGQFANKFSINFDTIDGVCRYIESMSSDKGHSEISDEDAAYFISNWYDQNLCSSDFILDIVDHFRIKSNINERKSIFPISLGFGGDGFKYHFHLLLVRTRLRVILSKILGRRFDTYYRNIEMNEHKFPSLTEVQIMSAIDFLCRLDNQLGSVQNYDVEMIGKKAFLLSMINDQ